MASIYTVGQVNSYIKNMFTEDFALKHISVKGEVSNCKYHSSGHIYFSLKDKYGVIACVMFKTYRKNLDFELKEGKQVVVCGSINVYERDGRYQLYAEQITSEGDGDLYRRFEMLKNELEEMGMFSSEYKKEIPLYAEKIGIVTAGTGAAIQDIINISHRRNPYVQLYLYPSLVQGEMASRDIVNGIRCLDSMDMDVIIVGRGGGSIEDLWAFNEELVARAVFECETPIISAVGHETDTTIIDYVSDRRAPTPSAAAEMAVFDYQQFSQNLEETENLLSRIISRKLEKDKSILNQYRLMVKNLSPGNRIREKKQYSDDLMNQLEDILLKKLRDRKNTLALLSERLNGLSPLNKLSKGYAYVSDNKGNSLLSINQVKSQDEVMIHLKDGNINTMVNEIIPGGLQDYGNRK